MPLYDSINRDDVEPRLKEVTGVEVSVLWALGSYTINVVGGYQVAICDYRQLTAFTHAFQCAVYDKHLNMVDRFNVNR